MTGGWRAACCWPWPWLWPAGKDEAEPRIGGRADKEEEEDEDDEATVGVVRPPAAPCVGVDARSDEAGEADRKDVLADGGSGD